MSADKTAAAVGAAMLLNYLAWLLAPALPLFLVCVLSAALMMLVYGGFESARQRFMPLAVVIVGFILVFFQPLTNWDARSIWFYHAKRMYFDGFLSARLDNYSAGWDNHPGYPDLLPAMAASITRIFDVWNEILPKTALVFMLFPPVVILIARCQRPSTRLLMLGMLLGLTQAQLLVGQMDAPLAIYAAACIVLTREALDHGCRAGAPFGFGPLIVLMACMVSIKDEGLAIALLVSIPMVHALLKSGHTKGAIARYLILALACGAPLLIWKAKLAGAHITVGLFDDDVAARIGSRLSSGDALLILKAILKQVWIPLGVFFAYCLYQRKVDWLTAYFVAAYLAILAMIYLLTPHDLSWHLATSLRRVVLAVKLAIGTAVVLGLQQRLFPTPVCGLEVALTRAAR